MSTIIPSLPPNVVSLSGESGAARAAADVLRRHEQEIARAIRRAVPFFTRRGIDPEAGKPRLAMSTRLTDGLEGPFYAVPLSIEPGGARAALVLDAAAIGYLLDGALGGDGSSTPKLDARGLTGAQKAFIARLCDPMVNALSDALDRAIGMRVAKLPVPGIEKSAATAMICLPLSLREPAPKGEALDGEEPAERRSRGTVVIALSKHALMSLGTPRAERLRPIDPRMARALEDVEVQLVAELDRMRVPLSKVAGLKVGDTLRLPVRVNAEVVVRVDDRPIFKARPTTVGTQLAVKLLGNASAPPAEEEVAAAAG